MMPLLMLTGWCRPPGPSSSSLAIMSPDNLEYHHSEDDDNDNNNEDNIC